MTSSHRHGTGKAALAGDVDKAIVGKAPIVHAHPDITARLAALEEAHAVTKALLLAATAGGSFNPPPASVPGAPTGVSATAGDTTASVSWTAPAANGGAAITNYEVTPYIGASAQAAVYTGSSATSKTVTGLTNGTAYTFKVAAVNSVGTGAQSTASAAVTPAAVSRPFAAPTTTATYTVPSTITHNGSADASAALNAWIATVPNGSIISFGIAGAVYRLDTGLQIVGRSNLVLEGHGTTTLTINGSASDYYDSPFLLQNSSHIAMQGFTVTGTFPGWPTMLGENLSVLTTLGWTDPGACSYIEIADITASRIFADFAYLEGSNGGTYPPVTDVWIHHCSMDYIGRNAVSFINCERVLVEDNTIDHVGYHMFDWEPNFAAEVPTDVTIRNNTCGSYSHRTGAGNIAMWVAASSPNSGPIVNLTVTGNTVAGIAANGVDGEPRALNSAFWGKSAAHLDNIVFTGNSTSRAVDGPAVLYFSYVDGVVCTGNTQPLLSSTLVLASNCTDTVTSPNP